MRVSLLPLVLMLQLSLFLLLRSYFVLLSADDVRKIMYCHMETAKKRCEENYDKKYKKKKKIAEVTLKQKKA